MELKPIYPFEPIIADNIPVGDQWIAQVKWDGVRVLTYFEEGQVRLFNRKLNERTSQYPEFLKIDQFCSAHSVILDGEIIALDGGKPSFYQVMKRDRMRKIENVDMKVKQIPAIYMIFDILYYNGQWMTNDPLYKRQELLNKIIIPTENVQIVPNFDDASQLFNVVQKEDLEGIVVKDLNSTYIINGKDKRWQKVKNYKDLIATIGGVTFRDGIVNAVLLGQYDEENKLWFIGHAGTGKLTSEDWRKLTQVITPLIQNNTPFINQPEKVKGTYWIKPEIQVKIRYIEWLDGHTLRQPSIQAFV